MTEPVSALVERQKILKDAFDSVDSADAKAGYTVGESSKRWFTEFLAQLAERGLCIERMEREAASRLAEGTRGDQCPHCGLYGSHRSNCEFEKFQSSSPSSAPAATPKPKRHKKGCAAIDDHHAMRLRRNVRSLSPRLSGYASAL